MVSYLTILFLGKPPVTKPVSNDIGFKQTGRGSLVGSMSTLQAAVPRSILAPSHSFVERKFPLPLIREELAVSYMRKGLQNIDTCEAV